MRRNDPFDIEGQVRAAIAPLEDQIRAMLKASHLRSDVLTPAQAAAFAFDGKIKASRVCEYIRGKNLPEGTTVALPAKQIGNTYHIPLDKLNRWRKGRATDADLYEWQRTGEHPRAAAALRASASASRRQAPKT